MTVYNPQPYINTDQGRALSNYVRIHIQVIHSYKLHTYNPSWERAQGDLGSPLRIQPTQGTCGTGTNKLRTTKSWYSHTRTSQISQRETERHVCLLWNSEENSPMTNTDTHTWTTGGL